MEVWYSFKAREEIIHRSPEPESSAPFAFFFWSVLEVFHLHKKVIGCLLKCPNAAVVAREKFVLIIISFKDLMSLQNSCKIWHANVPPDLFDCGVHTQVFTAFVFDFLQFSHFQLMLQYVVTCCMVLWACFWAFLTSSQGSKSMQDGWGESDGPVTGTRHSSWEEEEEGGVWNTAGSQGSSSSHNSTSWGQGGKKTQMKVKHSNDSWLQCCLKAVWLMC